MGVGHDARGKDGWEPKDFECPKFIPREFSPSPQLEWEITRRDSENYDGSEQVMYSN